MELTPTRPIASRIRANLVASKTTGKSKIYALTFALMGGQSNG